MSKQDKIETDASGQATSGAEALGALSRRDFMRGVLAAGTLAIGGSTLAGCGTANAAGSGSSSEDGAAASAQAAGNNDFSSLFSDPVVATGKDPIPPVDPPANWDRSADIVVVGLGGGGLGASLKAVLDGASVIAVEKAPHAGGSSAWATSFAVPGGSRVQNAAGVPYDYEAVAGMLVANTGNSADIPLIRRLLAEGPQFIDWMEELGAEWEVEPVLGDGLCWKGSTADGFIAGAVMPACDFALAKAEEAGVEFLYNTEAVALVKEGERVTGIKVSGGEGDLFIQASKAVILTAGGMLNNKDLLSEYCPTVAKRVLASMASTTDTGEVIRMGLGAGAQIAGWDSYCAFDGAMHWPGWTHFLYAGDVQLIRQPWLGLSSEGVRYPYYDDHVGRRYPAFPGLEPMVKTFALFAQAEVLQAQPGACGYLFFDADYEKNAPVFGQTFCRKLVTSDMANLDRMPETVGPHDWTKGAKSAIEQGIIKQGNTIEELAEAMGYDPARLKQAIESWNAICEAGVDTEMEFPAEWLIPVKNPPFYGAAIGSYAISSNAGLRVNSDMAVLDKKGNPISGLYAGGMTTGGANGESTYGVAYSPLGTVALAWTMGYIAAKSALTA